MSSVSQQTISFGFAFDAFVMGEALRRLANDETIRLSAADLPIADAFCRVMTKGRPGRDMHPGLRHLALLTLRTTEGVRIAIRRLVANGVLELDASARRGRLAAAYRFADVVLETFEAIRQEWSGRAPMPETLVADDASTPRSLGSTAASTPTTLVPSMEVQKVQVQATDGPERTETSTSTSVGVRTSADLYSLRFGKHKGQPLAACDDGYIAFLLTQSWLHADTRAAVEAERRRRDAAAHESLATDHAIDRTDTLLAEYARKRAERATPSTVRSILATVRSAVEGRRHAAAA